MRELYSGISQDKRDYAAKTNNPKISVAEHSKDLFFFTHAESAAGSGALQAHSFQAGIQDLMVFHPVTLASEHILAMVEERVV